MHTHRENITKPHTVSHFIRGSLIANNEMSIMMQDCRKAKTVSVAQRKKNDLATAVRNDHASWNLQR